MNNIAVNCCGVSAVILKQVKREYRILLLKRAEKPIGVWTYISGSLEKGEKFWEAAFREICEEVDLKPAVIYNADFCEQFYLTDSDLIWTAPVFTAYVSDQDQVKLNEEHSEYGWVTIAEAKEMVTYPGHRKVIAHIETEFVQKKPADFLMIKNSTV